MANTATLIDAIPTRIGGLGPLLEYDIVIDTINTPLTVFTPAIVTDRLFITGILIAESNATNLTLSDGTKTMTFELGANQGLSGLVLANGFYFATLPGAPLIVQATAAIGDAVGCNFILKLLQGTFFNNEF
jgi:hypothetical protein